jgi:hypothetical protein
MIKRIAAIASVLLAAGALTAGSVPAASAATTPLIHWDAETHLSAGPDVTCSSGIETFENYTDGGNGQYLYSRVGSPYQLLSNTAHTGYCMLPSALNSGEDIMLEALGVKDEPICLNVSTTTHDVYGAACNQKSKTEAILETEYVPGVVQMEFNEDTGGCIYDEGSGSPAEWHSCDLSNFSDLWIISVSP